MPNLKDIIQDAVSNLHDDNLHFHHKSMSDSNYEAFIERNGNATLVVLDNLNIENINQTPTFVKYKSHAFTLRVLCLDEHFNDTEDSQVQIEAAKTIAYKIMDLASYDIRTHILESEQLTYRVVPEFKIFGSIYTGVRVENVNGFKTIESPYICT